MHYFKGRDICQTHYRHKYTHKNAIHIKFTNYLKSINSLKGLLRMPTNPVRCSKHYVKYKMQTSDNIFFRHPQYFTFILNQVTVQMIKMRVPDLARMIDVMHTLIAISFVYKTKLTCGQKTCRYLHKDNKPIGNAKVQFWPTRATLAING